MAQRRMFSKDITSSDLFVDMPASSQLLYFQLGMEADDEGFIGNAKMLSRAYGANNDDLKLLQAKGFIIIFDSGVTVVRDWKINNQIRKDRFKPTIYQSEKSLLKVTSTGAYSLGNQMATKWQPSDNQFGNQMATQYRIGEDRIGKDRIEEVREKKSSTTSAKNQNLKHFFEKWQEITGRALTPFEIEDIPKLHKEDNFSIELMLTALKEAANSTSNFNFNYFKSILMRYKRQGLLTPEMVAGAEKQRQEAKSKQYNQQPSKSNVPDWVEADYKHEATLEEQAKLDELKKSLMED